MPARSVAVVVFAVLLSKNLVLGVPDFLPPYKNHLDTGSESFTLVLVHHNQFLLLFKTPFCINFSHFLSLCFYREFSDVMRLIIQPNYDDVSEWVANYVVKRINDFAPSAQQPFVLGLPTGSR